MRKKILAGALATVAIGAGAFFAPSAAFATTAVDDDYTPQVGADPTLTGSVVSAQCHGDAPYISFDVKLTDPDHKATNDTASLIITDGANTITLPLGQLIDDRLQGKVLWPGASVGSDGKAASLPGWVKTNGVWTQDPSHFGWTRGDITATLKVNPELEVPLHADFMEMACETPVVAGETPPVVAGETPPVEGAPASSGEATPLALTGQVFSWSALVAGIGAIGAGIVLLVRRRRATS